MQFTVVVTFSEIHPIFFGLLGQQFKIALSIFLQKVKELAFTFIFHVESDGVSVCDSSSRQNNKLGDFNQKLVIIWTVLRLNLQSTFYRLMDLFQFIFCKIYCFHVVRVSLKEKWQTLCIKLVNKGIFTKCFSHFLVTFFVNSLLTTYIFMVMISVVIHTQPAKFSTAFAPHVHASVLFFNKQLAFGAWLYITNHSNCIFRAWSFQP